MGLRHRHCLWRHPDASCPLEFCRHGTFYLQRLRRLYLLQSHHVDRHAPAHRSSQLRRWYRRLRQCMGTGQRRNLHLHLRRCRGRDTCRRAAVPWGPQWNARHDAVKVERLGSDLRYMPCWIIVVGLFGHARTHIWCIGQSLVSDR